MKSPLANVQAILAGLQDGEKKEGGICRLSPGHGLRNQSYSMR